MISKKRKLRIALRIAEVCDFLSEDIKFNEVMEEFEGYGISKLEEEIINEYFKENDDI